MNWLNEVVEIAIARHPAGDIVVSSGVSPSGKYHLGTLREVLTAEVIMRELKRRGRSARHIHVVDDLDPLRKIPSDVPQDFSQHLGKPLCDVPAPGGGDQSYADYFVADLLAVADKMNLEMEVIRAQQKYREGFFVPAIERALSNMQQIRKILEDVSGRKLDDSWSPIQVLDGGYLKSRAFKSIDSKSKEISYLDPTGQERTVSYLHGEVKLNWRIDWPARWWLLGVDVEPFGRDHATKGGSYDTGKVIAAKVFGTVPPLPVPYHFINRSGETKKMSKSAGNVVTASELLDILPPEIIWYFLLRFDPGKQLFFDEGPELMQLFDDFAELLAKADKSEQEQQLIELCLTGIDRPTASNIPFTHLVSSYQASLRDPDRTLDVIKRTEHADVAAKDADTIVRELKFIDSWLNKRAPDDIKFDLLDSVNPDDFSLAERDFLRQLAAKIAGAPANADGDWFHKAIYEFSDSLGLAPKAMFEVLYRVLIGKTSGPRAGWFLSILPKDWLLERLNLDD